MTRNKAIQVLDNERKEYIIKGCQLDKAIDMAIEALSERTGEWININTTNPPSFYHMGECSICGAHGQITDNFCPNCGADMRERRET